MVNDHKSELVVVKNDVQLIHDALYQMFKRVMNTGVSITGALIALLLAIIGYLLVNPVRLQ